MLLADGSKAREAIVFPMNRKAHDLPMGAPNGPVRGHLKELYLEIKWPEGNS